MGHTYRARVWTTMLSATKVVTLVLVLGVASSLTWNDVPSFSLSDFKGSGADGAQKKRFPHIRKTKRISRKKQNKPTGHADARNQAIAKAKEIMKKNGGKLPVLTKNKESRKKRTQDIKNRIKALKKNFKVNYKKGDKKSGSKGLSKKEVNKKIHELREQLNKTQKAIAARKAKRKQQKGKKGAKKAKKGAKKNVAVSIPPQAQNEVRSLSEGAVVNEEGKPVVVKVKAVKKKAGKKNGKKNGKKAQNKAQKKKAKAQKKKNIKKKQIKASLKTAVKKACPHC